MGTWYQGKILFCGGTERDIGMCYSQKIKASYTEGGANNKSDSNAEEWHLEEDMVMSTSRIQPTAVMIDEDTWWITGGHMGDEKGLFTTEILKQA